MYLGGATSDRITSPNTAHEYKRNHQISKGCSRRTTPQNINMSSVLNYIFCILFDKARNAGLKFG